MKCNSWASLLAHTFANPCHGREPKVKVATIKLGTFRWPPSYGLPLPFSFLFFLKARIWIICLSLFGCDFRFESLKKNSYNFPWEEKSNES
jgi:hypothetical protein